MTSFVRLSNFDNVVTATKTLQANETIEGIKTLQSVPKGHKIASCDIKKGNQVTKYAQCIGYASVDITAGEHVHTHNVEFRNTDLSIEDFDNLKIFNREEGMGSVGYQRRGEGRRRVKTVILPIDEALKLVPDRGYLYMDKVGTEYMDAMESNIGKAIL